MNEVSSQPDCDGRLRRLFVPHIESFDYALDAGLEQAVAALEPEEVAHPSADSRPLCFWLESVAVARPMRTDHGTIQGGERLWPSECRTRGLTYRGALHATLCRRLGDGDVERLQVRLGAVPVMVGSKRCHLRELSAASLVRRHEEATECGGYFIVNGNERLIRLLVVPRRNHVVAISRPTYRNRGPGFTQYATVIRCARPDQSSQTVALHLLEGGDAKLRLTVSKQEFFVPLVLLLRALRPTSDAELFHRGCGGDTSDSFVCDRLQLMLLEAARLPEALHTPDQCLSFLGARFRPILRPPARLTDAEVGRLLLRRHVLVHLAAEAVDAKWELLLLMLQKLYALAAERCAEDSPDSLVNQEMLLPGHLWLMILQEKLRAFLAAVRDAVVKKIEGAADDADFRDARWFRGCLDKGLGKMKDVGQKLTYFLATGNLVSETGLDLQQSAGYTIVAERLNYWRYLAHFRSIHRGAFFAQLRTTSVRKLLPDSWGFLCPVHTPDGSPCGLLNHLAVACHVAVLTPPRDAVAHVIGAAAAAAGAVLLPLGATLPTATHLPILFDGELIARVPDTAAAAVEGALRRLKVRGRGDGASAAAVPAEVAAAVRTLEIALVPSDGAGRFPALLVFSGPARFLRPVVNIQLGALEQIGSLEQTTLRIAYGRDDIGPHATHSETSPTALFSLVASITPFCDFNQSPRNMYQCQMGKQTMGTPYHAAPHRVDTKAYRLQTPQSPIVRNSNYGAYALDEYALGTNAVVAVISYTGYDMEDAMIVNKMSLERGLAHASLHITVTVDLNVLRRKGEPLAHRFGNRAAAAEEGPHAPNEERDGRLFCERLGEDGLPPVGARLKHDDPLCAIVDETTGRHTLKRHKYTDEAVVEGVQLLGGDGSAAGCEAAQIKLRFNRNPIPGDKFASRHGQKGVMSRLWPAEDMPFSESGLVPDILFNPHGFPSRMTIGMLLESMAGKAGALHGLRQDSTPFQYDEKERAVDAFGEQLAAAGYAYHGTETLYSGVYGTELQVNIFVGVVYYQRLRHMVSDKHQVRARGPINPVTRQPVQGRKVHGGIRLGEMERDALLAHGAAFLVHDRLFRCSDEHKALVCATCGSLLAPMVQSARRVGGAAANAATRQPHCRACGHGDGVEVVSIPFVFKYLTNELAAMNIKTTLRV